MLTYPDGTPCTGQWSSAAGSQVSYNSMTLFGTYGSVYGSGVSVSEGGGQNPGRAFLNCPNGNQIDIEFVTGAGTANGFGFAKDKQGNIFRVLF